MKIKQLVIVLSVFVILISGCKKSNEFTIRGKITHAEGRDIYLEELLVSSVKPVAQTKINKKGEFKFSGVASYPTYYLLKLSDSNFITLLIDSTENIVIEADEVNFAREYNVEGSLGSILVKELNSHLIKTKARLDSLNTLYKMYRGNPDYDEKVKEWDEQYIEVKKNQIEFSTNFVKNNPFSMASILALYQKFENTDQGFIVNDLQTMRTAASALNSIYPKSEHVKALYQNTLKLLQNEQAARVKKFIEENGDNSPDIVLPNPEGKEIALSSLRGKVVLLQFWAAVDKGSRIVNPVLVEAYNKYKRKGFEIYQVSLDDNRIEWVDAIDKDKLTWTNVGDMEGCIHAVQVYNIKKVPYNYLLDKEGKIIAQNLTGPALDRALSKVLN